MTKLEYKEYLENVSEYSTLKEKNTLIKLLGETSALEMAKTLDLKPFPKNELEAIAMIFQARKKSVGETIEVTIQCNCGAMDFYSIDIDSFFFQGNINESIPIKLIDSIEDFDDNDKINDILINTLTIKEYNEVEKIIIENNKSIFNNNFEVNCKKCGNIIHSYVDYKNIISKFPIKNVYEQYLDLTQFTNMTKQDVDNMFPFEREIFINMIQERKNKEQG
jgi:hypothetical protein